MGLFAWSRLRIVESRDGLIDAAQPSTADECPKPYLYPSCHPPLRGEKQRGDTGQRPRGAYCFCEIRPHRGNAWTPPLAAGWARSRWRLPRCGKSVSPAGFRLRSGIGPPDALVRKKLVLGALGCEEWRLGGMEKRGAQETSRTADQLGRDGTRYSSCGNWSGSAVVLQKHIAELASWTRARLFIVFNIGSLIQIQIPAKLSRNAIHVSHPFARLCN
ncbi:hypothetical protein EDB80DRAFT_279524 [Ilyonectria destructans]|nr:hypothetical protein EDB80DRAFT_279524 [Ilyonectria destructans]